MSSFDHIAHDLRARISQGEWLQGMRLPTERNLAETYVVSRNTIRRALDELEGDGLLSRHVGRGTFVIAVTGLPEGYSDTLMKRMASASPLAVLEVRLIIEPQAAALAAARASRSDVEAIEAALSGSLNAHDLAAFEHWDARLHQAIFDATQNDLLADYCRALSEVRNQPKWMQMKAKSLTAERRAAYNAHHELIVAAIRVHDTAEAAERMQEHLRAVRDAMLPFL